MLNGTSARFIPSANFYGRASFQFGVFDNQGASLTNTINLHVRALPQSQLAVSLTNGTPHLYFSGEPGFYFLLQYSDDLVHWTTWTNVTTTASATEVSGPALPVGPARYFRSLSVQ